MPIKTKKILFRADAAPHIGIGDLMSLINVSYYFSDNYELYFIVKNYNASLELISKYGVQNCFIIDSKLSISDEISYMNTFIDDYFIDMLFLEITEIRLSEYVGLNDRIKTVAVNFDGHILNDMDLVIDWDVEAYKFFEPDKYPNTKFLLGAKYVILPESFYDKKVENRKFNNSKNHILIAMGGADELDFTSKVVKSIINFNLDLTLNIVIGPSYEHKDNLEKMLKNSNLKYQIKQNVTNMLDEYLSCDIGIGAGGLTSSELVATKTSPILIATYKHQVARCEYFHNKGLAKYLGYRCFDDNELLDAILNPISIINNNIFNTKCIIKEIEKLLK